MGSLIPCPSCHRHVESTRPPVRSARWRSSRRRPPAPARGPVLVTHRPASAAPRWLWRARRSCAPPASARPPRPTERRSSPMRGRASTPPARPLTRPRTPTPNSLPPAGWIALPLDVHFKACRAQGHMARKRLDSQHFMDLVGIINSASLQNQSAFADRTDVLGWVSVDQI
jgi:hypothetical protein